VCIFGLPDAAAWPYIVASWTLHVGYYIALTGAYRHGDLGLTYPLMRGTAPLMVAMASLAFIGERLSPLAWAGVGAISVGVLALGLSRGRLRAAGQNRNKAVAFALANACIIALYTVIDGLGVRASGDVAAYVAALFVFDGLPYCALVLWQRGERRGDALRYMATRWLPATAGAAASLGSYAIALWAMTQAPVAAVAALRETSVLFAALIGWMLLREPFGWQRAAGTAAIVVGMMTLRVG
jgi:drug/metabolite transporter (DMT)-like permease